jgi:WD40 repeat protein
LTDRCRSCGTELPPDEVQLGQCQHCLSGAVSDQHRGGELTEAQTLDAPAPGQVLAGRYQMRELLGRGGMGDVWRAFDLKLRVDVALKAIRPGRTEHDRAKERLRQEVRSAREVVSPNVCRIFDLVVEGDDELVSMELVDGSTLSETLRVRGPLPLQEAREVASQFLSGLEAIHQAGLVHRDFKPENVMLTRAGRVVVMDFGLAKAGMSRETGSVSGTPAYMPPEQARGDRVDARADVFAAGVVLAEMVSVGGEGLLEARRALWRDLRQTPPKLSEGPWARVLRQALDPLAEKRFPSAHALARALEAATQRLPGLEDRKPYPGLASFTEADAEYFFGREVEVEAVWKKLKRPRLLALIGPSGAGKSSFLRAGLMPTLPSSWRAVTATPGTRPFHALARTLLPHFAGDTEALEALLRFDDADTAVSLVGTWRRRHEQVVVIIDQFEELFTQNLKDVQTAFAAFLGRLVLEADCQVVLALRDDFLIHCHAHEALAPAFSDLTPLGPLSETGLRRALVQPALSCGYRFEDEALVDEMVGAVKGERGALPLLAFAASRLFELRDRERGILTWEAYRQIGGVAGALAQHAEATLERIGVERLGLVRELFRNLVTAQGTRAVRERADLLSMFPDLESEAGRRSAEAVLNALVDARLLTSYDRGDAADSHQQVEIIHESLLVNWPRLVRWRTQDEDGAQLRDQLRQAAQLWHDRGRAEDLLWTGPSYQEFAVWKTRYPGALSTLEEDYAGAMTGRATRQRRRRRLAGVSLLAIAASVAIVTSGLWRRADASRRVAEEERLLAEASKLLALGQVELDRYPTAALAYATKSLELDDRIAARLFALRALQRGPTATLTPRLAWDASALGRPDFSPDGEWLAFSGWQRVSVFRSDGSGPLVLGGDFRGEEHFLNARFGLKSDLLACIRYGELRIWSLPEGRELRRQSFAPGVSGLWMNREGFVSVMGSPTRRTLRQHHLGDDSVRIIGTFRKRLVGAISQDHMAFVEGRRVYQKSFAQWDAPPLLLAQDAAEIDDVEYSPDGQRLLVRDSSGEIRIWPIATRAPRPLRVIKMGTGLFRSSWLDRSGAWVGAVFEERKSSEIRFWDPEAPPAAEPIVGRREGAPYWNGLVFDPTGRWAAMASDIDGTLWFLGDPHPHVLVVGEAISGGDSLAFAPHGEALLVAGHDGIVRWPLSAANGEEKRVLVKEDLDTYAFDGAGRCLALTGKRRFLIATPDGAAPRELGSVLSPSAVGSVQAFDGDRLAFAARTGPLEDRLIKIVDLRSGIVQVLPPVLGVFDRAESFLIAVQFLGRDRLLASVMERGLLLYDLSHKTGRVIAPEVGGRFAVSADQRFGVGARLPPDESPGGGRPSELYRFSLDGGPTKVLRAHGDRVIAVALSPDGTLVATGSVDGTVRIGKVSGEEPHVFFGHEGLVWSAAFSPDGKWLATGGHDMTVRLWPVPDCSKPAPQTWPRERFLAFLHSRTNVIAARDPTSPTGWKIDRGPFPGWAGPAEH